MEIKDYMDNKNIQTTTRVDIQTQPTGKIIGVQGQVVEVEFAQNSTPAIRDILVLVDDDKARMEVLKSSGANSFYCILFSESANLARGQKVVNTGKQISIYVGKAVLSRVVNIFGEPLDGGPEIAGAVKKSIYGEPFSYDELAINNQILETGIKAIDFFSPISKGGKIGLFGGAGVGKTILLTEIIHNVVALDPAKKRFGFCRSWRTRKRRSGAF